MADDPQRPTGRGRGGFQPVEPVVEPQRMPATQTAPPPVVPYVPPAPPDEPATARAASPEPAPVVPFAARFGSAASALVYTGQLLAIGGAESLGFRTGPERSWWVLARLDLDVAREFAAATRGEAYVEAAPGRLVPDRGWGGPPSVGDGRAEVAAADLATVDTRDLVRVAGLHATPERPLAEVSVLLPGSLTSDIVRRALDLRLDVAHRAVRLSPLFNGASGGTSDAPAVVELRVSAPGGHVPGGLLLALARDHRLTVCRRTGENGNLLIQYGMATPLLDHLLAGLVRTESWLLSRGPLGCRSVESVDGFTDSTSLLRLADGHPLESEQPVEDDDEPDLPRLRVVPSRTPGVDVDALLLATDDLGTISLLLEGHPLADSAQLVRGRDRHLLLAPGGLLEPLPVGEALYCWGPGPLYLPLGHVTRPQLPPSARRALFEACEQTAVVLLPDVRIHFNLADRDPVWTLWAGPPPPVEEALPAETAAALADITGPAPDQGPDIVGPAPEEGRRDTGRLARLRRRAAARRPEPATTGTWLDEALASELSGALVRAAELHLRHGDPVRAAHLFERAARESPTPNPH